MVGVRPLLEGTPPKNGTAAGNRFGAESAVWSPVVWWFGGLVVWWFGFPFTRKKPGLYGTFGLLERAIKPLADASGLVLFEDFAEIMGSHPGTPTKTHRFGPKGPRPVPRAEASAKSEDAALCLFDVLAEVQKQLTRGAPKRVAFS